MMFSIYIYKMFSINIYKNGEKIGHLLYMDDLKFYAKNEKDLDCLIQSVRVFSKDMCMQFGVKMCSVDYEEGSTD